VTTRTRITETQWQEQVVELAELYGWTWMHLRPARTKESWRTPVQGALGKGWPDLVLVRDRVVYAELKRDGRRLTDAQAVVIDTLRAAGAEVYVWRPEDFETVQHILAWDRG
jgi:hypothetical protein